MNQNITKSANLIPLPTIAVYLLIQHGKIIHAAQHINGIQFHKLSNLHDWQVYVGFYDEFKKSNVRGPLLDVKGIPVNAKQCEMTIKARSFSMNTLSPVANNLYLYNNYVLIKDRLRQLCIDGDLCNPYDLPAITVRYY